MQMVRNSVQKRKRDNGLQDREVHAKRPKVKKARKIPVCVWAVMVSYHYGEESYAYELETDVKLFTNFADAVKELERVIRHDWTAVVEGGDYLHPKSLADMRGRSSYEDSVKHSRWYYSEDGTTAWAFYSDGHGYKGEVVQLPVNGLWKEI